MIEKNIKIPMIVCVALEAFVLLTVFALIQGQDVIIQAFMASATGIHVFPLRTVLSVVFRLVLFLSCLLTMLYYKGEHRRMVSVIFIALLLLSSIASPYIATAANALAARKEGVEYYATYGSVTSAISLCIGPFGAVSTALYFIACGRYGISNPETDFDPNNYIQP